MNFKKLLLSAVTALCMSALLCTGALAVDLDDARFAGKTWEEVFSDFLTQQNVDPAKVTAGYYNTVTGEEYYHNKGTLMYGASVAKLPTNMVFAERIYNGEMDWDTLIGGTRYETVQKLTLINSDNPAQAAMVQKLGGGNYANFRKTILPYLGLTEEDVDSKFLARNWFAPEHILSCLKQLYGNAERFPGVEECMKQAHQYDFFCGNQPPYTIAHKYGWYNDNGTEYVNDSAIVYTDDPILLVMFTASVGQKARAFLADYCSLMIDYTQYQRAIRYRDTALSLPEMSIPTQLSYIVSSPPADTPSGYATWQPAVLGVGALMLIIAVILLISKKWWTLLFLLLGLALGAVSIAPTAFAYYSVEEGYARQVIADFDAAFADNYGVDYLAHYDNTKDPVSGSNMPSTILNKVTESFEVQADSVRVAGNYPAVEVTYRKADLQAINDALQPAWEATVLSDLAAANVTDLFDTDGNFNTSITDRASEAALNAVLDSWEDYMVTETTTLHLTIGLDGYMPTWKIVCNDAFLDMVNY